MTTKEGQELFAKTANFADPMNTSIMLLKIHAPTWREIYEKGELKVGFGPALDVDWRDKIFREAGRKVVADDDPEEEDEEDEEVVVARRGSVMGRVSALERRGSFEVIMGRSNLVNRGEGMGVAERGVEGVDSVEGEAPSEVVEERGEAEETALEDAGLAAPVEMQEVADISPEETPVEEVVEEKKEALAEEGFTQKFFQLFFWISTFFRRMSSSPHGRGNSGLYYDSNFSNSSTHPTTL